MKTITILAAVLIAGAGRVYAASGAGGGDVNRDVVDDANAALGHANNALNAANALLNQLAQGNSGQTPAAPPVQQPQPGYADAVGCFDAAYSGTSLSREEAMRLCAGAMDSGPAVCFMQAYSGTSLTKDEALQMCASGHHHKELRPGAAAGARATAQIEAKSETGAIPAEMLVYRSSEVFNLESEAASRMAGKIRDLERAGGKIVLYQVLAVEGGRYTFTIVYIPGEALPVIIGPLPFLEAYGFRPSGVYGSRQDAMAALGACVAKMKARGRFRLDSAKVLNIHERHTFEITFHSDLVMEKYQGKPYSSHSPAAAECARVAEYASLRRVFSFPTITGSAGGFVCDMLYAGPEIDLSEE